MPRPWLANAWFLSALLGTAVAALAVPASGQPIAPALDDQATEVIDLAADRHERMTVPVIIEGQGPFDFMIDTGSQATAISDTVNARLGLQPSRKATLIGMASTRLVDLVDLGSLELGNRTFYDLSAPVLNRQHLGVDGIIGLDSLQDLRVLIDFRDDTIAVADIDEKPSDRGFEIIVRAKQRSGQLLITDAIVDGVRATVIIDTGAQTSMGNIALREKIRQRRAQIVTTTDVNGVSLTGQLSFARSLTIQDITIQDVPITYADAPAFEALGLKDRPTLSLGMQHLRLFDRVAIDFARRRILFDVPRGAYRNRTSRL